MRTWNAIKISEAINHLLGPNNDVDPIEWLSRAGNIVLENDRGDLAMFEFGFPLKKYHSGHYYFQSRGRQAIQAAKAFLDELFNTCYNVHIVVGLTPTHRKDAKWMNRQVGFTAYGIHDICDKQYELFILTKKEFNNE